MPSPIRLIGAIGAIAAGVVGIGVSLKSHKADPPPETQVYLATSAIPEGTQITSSLVRVYSVPQGAVSSTMITAQNDPIGDYATTNIPQYGYLYQGQISSKGTWANGIPPGMEAVDVTVNPASLAGVTPGETVALFGTLGRSQDNTELVSSTLILGLYTSQLQLISAAPQAGLSAVTSGTPSIVRFAVTPTQAAILTQAISQGSTIYIVQGETQTTPSAAPSTPAPAARGTQTKATHAKTAKVPPSSAKAPPSSAPAAKKA